ncbi:hypothetical protein PoB_002558400 [Plakobranchus ocellatus]|uniref:EF-hand domain-containing protein n=1 Tax=Plakobranchus ocellatus TaxID=259542 RepID=A0AAV3ZXF5_9GAST|nr:hypothetical protein PoB_002558400 [Plakobranchus ocellatus]
MGSLKELHGSEAVGAGCCIMIDTCPSAEDAKDSTAEVFSDKTLTELVEATLRTEDQNGDGYVEYWEFMASQVQRRRHVTQGGPPALEDNS